MTALGKLVRTTAFKLSLGYLAAFVVMAALVLGYVTQSARDLLIEQTRTTIAAETAGLAEQYRIGGVRRLVLAVDRRTRLPGASLYLLTTFAGERLAGNVGELPAGVLDEEGSRIISYRRDDRHEDRQIEGRALVQVYVLPGGFRLLVGRDLEEQERLRQVMWRAAGVSLTLITVLGCLGGWFITRRVLKRVDEMSQTAKTIMAGDLAGRLPVTGTGDELDRLAMHLNEMLERISELMNGLKEVSDNIAHDLKTPLTRLRNHAEEALRGARAPEDYQAALGAVIEEADNLIKVFNALLMIARLEAGGQPQESMAEFDAAEVARSVIELYEPVAEDLGFTVSVDLPERLPLYGSRELLGQALANLIDNAFKYAAPAGGEAGEGRDPSAGRPQLAVAARRTAQGVEISVSDNGPGIPEAQRGQVVQRFVRLEGARSRPGFGLGLSLVAAVARLHGGRLRIEDNRPGLRVVLELPGKGATA
ncbi:ATP-binding protein [Camelimonas abortus]|uniref:histidine kinase n=1 Tax=Camelimonas abortus TaxID=1017184 RepID=A0ABV7LFL0_9HYPH